MTEELDGVKKMLDDHEKRIVELERSLPVGTDTTPAVEGNDADKLARKIGVPTDKLREVFDVEGEVLTVLKCVGDKEKEKTQNIALLALLGYKFFIKKDGILSQEIRRNVAGNKIPLNNFATYLNELSPRSLLRKGEPKSPKTTYRLTHFGEATAKEILKTAIGN